MADPNPAPSKRARRSRGRSHHNYNLFLPYLPPAELSPSQSPNEKHPPTSKPTTPTTPPTTTTTTTTTTSHQLLPPLALSQGLHSKQNASSIVYQCDCDEEGCDKIACMQIRCGCDVESIALCRDCLPDYFTEECFRCSVCDFPVDVRGLKEDGKPYYNPLQKIIIPPQTSTSNHLIADEILGFGFFAGGTTSNIKEINPPNYLNDLSTVQMILLNNNTLVCLDNATRTSQIPTEHFCEYVKLCILETPELQRLMIYTNTILSVILLDTFNGIMTTRVFESLIGDRHEDNTVTIINVTSEMDYYCKELIPLVEECHSYARDEIKKHADKDGNVTGTKAGVTAGCGWYFNTKLSELMKLRGCGVVMCKWGSGDTITTTEAEHTDVVRRYRRGEIEKNWTYHPKAKGPGYYRRTSKNYTGTDNIMLFPDEVTPHSLIETAGRNIESAYACSDYYKMTDGRPIMTVAVAAMSPAMSADRWKCANWSAVIKEFLIQFRDDLKLIDETGRRK
jgi:hypothetical protein